MSKKKSKPQSPAAPAPKPEAPLPAPLRMLDADYSAVLRMRNVRWLIVIAACVAALLLGAHLSAVFVPLLVAMAAAYVFNPLVLRLQRRGTPRKRAVLWIFAGLMVAMLAVGTWAVAAVIRDVRDVNDRLGSLLKDVRENQRPWIESWNEVVWEPLRFDPERDVLGAITQAAIDQFAPRRADTDPAEQSARAAMVQARAGLLAAFQNADRDRNLRLDATEISQAEITAMDTDKDGAVSTEEWFTRFGAPALGDSRALSPQAQSLGNTLIDSAGTGLSGLLTMLLWVTLIPIYTWYFMVGYDGVMGRVREFLPGRHRERILRIAREIDAMLKAFFRGRIVVVLIIAAATTVVYLLFGVQYAVLLGLLSGLGVLIPYFSMVAGWIPALILMAINGDSAAAIIGMSVCFHAIQAIEQYVLTPKLLGDAVELHPVTLLVGVFVMTSLFGLFGALLAVPLTAIARTLGREFLLPYFRSLAAEKPG